MNKAMEFVVREVYVFSGNEVQGAIECGFPEGAHR